MKCVAQLKMLKWDNITGTLRYPVEISGVLLGPRFAVASW
jgi:hypothetical protein